MIIDVSHNNGQIDWAKVSPHIEKAILRVGYGNDDPKQDDRQYARNRAECERLGIPYDVYIYSYAKTVAEAQSEARHVMRLAGKDKIIYFDSEEPGTQYVALTCAEAFRDALKEKGYRAGLYASESWYKSYLAGVKGFASLWIAKYGRNDGNMNARPLVDCNIWQYTSVARIAGIKGDVDANVILKADKKPKKLKKEKNAVYRFYNPKKGVHRWEYDYDKANELYNSSNWKYEQIAFYAKPSGNIPVHQFYNSATGERMLTTSDKEKDSLKKSGWQYKGIAFYAEKKSKGNPIYRLRGKEHMFTKSKAEKDSLVKTGWVSEGVAFYAL